MVDVLPAGTSERRRGLVPWHRRLGVPEPGHAGADPQQPTDVVVAAGDDVYKMDHAILLRGHVARGKGCTVTCIKVLLQVARTYGAMSVTQNGTLSSFAEGPAEPVAMPEQPDQAMDSMGVYVFDVRYLVESLDGRSSRPFVHPRFRTRHRSARGGGPARGRPLVPALLRDAGRAAGRAPYWRHIDTLDTFLSTNLDLAAVIPSLDLCDAQMAHLDRPETTAAGKVRARHGRAAWPGRQQHGIGPAASWSAPASRTQSFFRTSVSRRSVTKLECVVLPGVTLGEQVRLRRGRRGNRLRHS